MKAFRLLLIVMIVTITTYTAHVGLHHGWNLLPLFFGEMTAMTWQGQFNVDFNGFLILSGLWLAWRHQFSLAGLVLGVFGLVGGIMFLAPYLLIVSFATKGDVKAMLLGPIRAQT